jgi:hypothetical protein
MSSPRGLARSLLGWPVETQLGSRRNALVASTALAQLRREREDAEDFLAASATRWAPPVAVPAALGANRDVI